eukprot:m.182502 g.182502  ORF g.182502 m.182502 type:complete len:87 (-) comp25484_c1_seq8:914-1174(-)
MKNKPLTTKSSDGNPSSSKQLPPSTINDAVTDDNKIQNLGAGITTNINPAVISTEVTPASEPNVLHALLANAADHQSMMLPRRPCI